MNFAHFLLYFISNLGFSSRRKEPIWQQVEMVTSTYSPDQILSSLLTNTQMSTLATKDMTSRVDIRRDAQNLR